MTLEELEMQLALLPLSASTADITVEGDGGEIVGIRYELGVVTIETEDLAPEPEHNEDDEDEP